MKKTIFKAFLIYPIRFLLFVFCCCLTKTSFAQAIPDPGFDWCNGVPTNTTVRALNRYLAHQNAPIIHLASQTFDNVIYDTPTLVDFDGNLNSLDNWNTVNTSTFGPSLYYSVLWTEDYFIITYSLFYPRDIGENEYDISFPLTPSGIFKALCYLVGLADLHENDLERIVVMVNRCTGAMAAVTTHHSKLDVDNCLGIESTLDLPGELSTIPESQRPPSVQPGRHLEVFVAEGSHAIYLKAQGASLDGLCTNPEIVRVLYPSANPTEQFSYALVDIFDPVIGVWQHRDVPTMFTQGDRGDQSFLGDEGPGSNRASAPWNGDLGLDPFPRLMDEFGGKVCGHILSPSPTYVYNPYQCPDLVFDGPTGDEAIFCGDDAQTFTYKVGIFHDFTAPFDIEVNIPNTLELLSVSEPDVDIDNSGTSTRLTADFPFEYEVRPVVVNDYFFTMEAKLNISDVQNSGYECEAAKEMVIVSGLPLAIDLATRIYGSTSPGEIPKLCLYNQNYVEAYYTGPDPGLILEWDWDVPSGWAIGFPNFPDKSIALIVPNSVGEFSVRARNECGWSSWISQALTVEDCHEWGFKKGGTDRSMEQQSSGTTAEIEAVDFKVYPNPFTSSFELSVDIPNSQQQRNLRVLNSLGKTIYLEELPLSGGVQKQIDLSEFAAGVYVVQLTIGEEQYTKRLLKLPKP